MAGSKSLNFDLSWEKLNKVFQKLGVSEREKKRLIDSCHAKKDVYDKIVNADFSNKLPTRLRAFFVSLSHAPLTVLFRMDEGEFKEGERLLEDWLSNPVVDQIVDDSDLDKIERCLVLAMQRKQGSKKQKYSGLFFIAKKGLKEKELNKIVKRLRGLGCYRVIGEMDVDTSVLNFDRTNMMFVDGRFFLYNFYFWFANYSPTPEVVSE